MAKARVFKSGNSQAVRLPKEFRVKSKELEIYKRGNAIVLEEQPAGMERAIDLIASLPEEILRIRRGKDRPQKRKGL
jgi:antitoxin VapB